MSDLEDQLRRHLHDLAVTIAGKRRESDVAMEVAVALDEERMRLEDLLARYGARKDGP